MKMDKTEAEYHMRRCVDSGLWVPNAEDAAKKADEQQKDDDDDDEDEIYEEASEN